MWLQGMTNLLARERSQLAGEGSQVVHGHSRLGVWLVACGSWRRWSVKLAVVLFSLQRGWLSTWGMQGRHNTPGVPSRGIERKASRPGVGHMRERKKSRPGARARKGRGQASKPGPALCLAAGPVAAWAAGLLLWALSWADLGQNLGRKKWALSLIDN